ncbi:hypothetical protein BS650_17895 [Aeromonas hydrophila]|uniref:Primosomal replication protein N n=2 Tax=Bacteria TaxID=2 RepID=A0AAW6QZW6_9GAMM|nr:MULTISPECIES: hypothetical protein [Gammaproteobacteria]EAR5800209.1 hypothetical protein [Salmonella enterica]EJD6500016.1 hypothetical protein [Providencia rettgeri]EFV4425339.1 hypothetical protein [Salmonella enterica]EJD6643460.1 hypothetical protein [Providencia rettgeri]EJJ9678823.1 hypothetical protein [Salmonella enterica]
MKKSENTLLKLEAALQRIIERKTKRIPDHRKLSVRAVEEEAGLGNGSCYYYPDFKLRVQSEVQKLKCLTPDTAVQSDVEILREKRNQERKIKIQYREKVAVLTQRLTSMAAEHHQLSHALRHAYSRIESLEHQVIELKQGQIIRIK